jgi:YidC/Oxa1 family membrane protein insertase
VSWLQEGFGAAITVFYQGIPSLGVAIILLTIAVNILMFPLTLKQTRSMRKMQELQPEIKRLQRELKHDKQALQQATMELYRERKVNPLAGCLPLLLQLPVWWALFGVLRSFAGEQASAHVLEGWRLFTDISQTAGTQLVGFVPPWRDFLWMDLGKNPGGAFADGWLTALPYLLTILIVMGTSYYQMVQTQAKQKKDTPEGEKQPGQAVMKMMPFFFGFISFTLPAGLAVYFAASQIFRIGQQAVIIWLDERREGGKEEGAGLEEGKKRERGGKGLEETAEPERRRRSRSPERRPRMPEAERRPAAPRSMGEGQKARGKKRKRR